MFYFECSISNVLISIVQLDDAEKLADESERGRKVIEARAAKVIMIHTDS